MAQEIITKPVPVYGLNTEDESIVFASPFSPKMVNAVVESTCIKKRTGYRKLGFDNVVAPLLGTGMELINYVDGAGEKHLIALTDKHAYLYVEAIRESGVITTSAYWKNISKRAAAEATNFTIGADNHDYNLPVMFMYSHPTAVAPAETPMSTYIFVPDTLVKLTINDAAVARSATSVKYDITLTFDNGALKYIDASWDSYTLRFYNMTLAYYDIVAGENADSVGVRIAVDKTLLAAWFAVYAYGRSDVELRAYVPGKNLSIIGNTTVTTSDTYRRNNSTLYAVKKVAGDTKVEFYVKQYANNYWDAFDVDTNIVDYTAGTSIELTYKLNDVTIHTGLWMKIESTTTLSESVYTFFSVYQEGIPYPVQYTGDKEDRFSHCVVTDANLVSCSVDTYVLPADTGYTALFASNNIDPIQYYPGKSTDVFQEFTYSKDYNGDGDITDEGETGISIGKAKEITEFWNYFMLLNSFVSTTKQEVKMVFHAGAGDLTAWIGTAYEGTAGYYRLTDSIGAIKRAIKLGQNLIIYSENSITVCSYYGGITLFSFPTVVFNVGLLGDKAIISADGAHFFMGNNQMVYLYGGDTQLVDISGRIRTKLFAEIDSSNNNGIVVGNDKGRSKLMFCIPVASSNGFANTVYALNYKRQEMSWEYYKYANYIRSVSTFVNSFTWYCDEEPMMNIYCDETVVLCDASYGQEGYEKTAFLSVYEGADGNNYSYVYSLDGIDFKDDTVDIPFEVQTPDFTFSAEEYFARWQWFSFVAKSKTNSTCNVYYRIDADDSDSNDWILISENLQLTPKWFNYRIPLDTDARVIRFKITNAAGDIQLRGVFKCKVVPHSERD